MTAGLVIGLVGGALWWILAVIFLLAGLQAGRADGASLLWARDELREKEERTSYVFWPRPHDSKDNDLVRASDIEPGDWICDRDKYQIRLDESTRNYQRKRMEELTRQEIRKQSQRPRIGPLGSYSVLSPDKASLDLRRRSDYLDISLPLLPTEPLMEWEQVVTILPSRNGKGVELGLLHGEKLTYSPVDRWYYRRRRRALGADLADAEDLAVIELMNFLTRDEGTSRESNVVGRLMGAGHSRQSIRRAIGSVLATGLATRVRDGGWWHEIFTALFHIGEATAGHKSCVIKLTNCGRAWVKAGDLKPERRRAKWYLPEKCPYCGAPVAQAVQAFADSPQCDSCRHPLPVQAVSPEESQD
jgi:hypothetical protein